MNVCKTKLVCFSPTGTTRRVLEYLASGIGLPAEVYDLTPFAARWEKYHFRRDELVLIGMPVYRGILPPVTDEFFRGMTADHTPAIFVVTYGNREYENALLELQDRAEEAGFTGIAGVAAIGEHSATSLIAPGRPDEKDALVLSAFGKRIRAKMTECNELTPLFVPGKRPYEKTVIPATQLIVSEQCIRCGLCAAECPVMAINPDDVYETDYLRCIGCLRCVRHCPSQAISLAGKHQEKVISMLMKTAAVRKEAELYMRGGSEVSETEDMH